MTPKEKAIELVDKYLNPYLSSPLYGIIEDLDMAKECALIAVDEILEVLLEQFPKYFSCEVQNMEWHLNYWARVYREIEKL